MSDLYRSLNREHSSHLAPMAIFRACMYGNLKYLNELLAAGADVNERSVFDRETPLMVAAKYGHLSVVNQLLKLDANVNYVDAMGRTALMTACRMGEVSCVKALLYSWQVDIDKVDNGGNTALILTASHISGPNCLSCLELLIGQDADVNIKNDIGMTATMYCAKNSSVGWEGVKMLIKAGADTEAVNDVGENLLMQVASQGDDEVLQWVIEMGINDIRKTNTYGDNALILGLKNGNGKCVDKLLQVGSNPNSISGQGSHALNIAASTSFKNTQLLLTHGAIPQLSKLYVQYKMIREESDEMRNAFLHCPDLFLPTDIAVLHKNFSVAKLLLTISSCYPLYDIYSVSQLENLSQLTRLVLQRIQLAAISCPKWVEISRERPSGPSTLLFLCQQVVSCMAGFSTRRRENLESYGLPPVLIRTILLEGLEESMFTLTVLNEEKLLN